MALLTLAWALALYDKNQNDSRVDAAIENAGQIPDNVRHLRGPVARMIVRAVEDGAIDEDE